MRGSYLHRLGHDEVDVLSLARPIGKKRYHKKSINKQVERTKSLFVSYKLSRSRGWVKTKVEIFCEKMEYETQYIIPLLYSSYHDPRSG